MHPFNSLFEALGEIKCRNHSHLSLSLANETIACQGFDWLARLDKRGEKFDIVILDPPSTSVGKKKRRWSVQKDTAKLVSLAAPFVAALVIILYCSLLSVYVCMILLGSGCRLQTCRGLAAQWFDSTLRTVDVFY